MDQGVNIDGTMRLLEDCTTKTIIDFSVTQFTRVFIQEMILNTK